MPQRKGVCGSFNAALSPVDVAVPNGHTTRFHAQGLIANTESNGAVSPAPPSRASPSPPATANGSFVADRSTAMANTDAAVPQTITAKNPKLAAQMANDLNIVRRKLTGYVGFANLPNQWHRKSVRKGFNFNVMVVGMCAAVQQPGSGALTQRQVNLVSESRLSSTHCSTPLCTLPRSASPQASISPRLSRYSPSAPTSRRTVSVFD